MPGNLKGACKDWRRIRQLEEMLMINYYYRTEYKQLNPDNAILKFAL
ncbi:hypothetical protein ACTJKC_04810 [Pedobacter sp. 22226]